MGVGNVRRGRPIGSISAAADFLGPGAIETNKYQSEIFDLVRRRGVLGQRINQTPATGQPSRYFEETQIPVANAADPRTIGASLVATQPQRIEQVLTLKALVAQINYSIFDVEVNQQQGQFAYLEAKDLTDAVDSVLKEHDKELWIGTDTNLIIPTTLQYFGISGQILNAPTLIVGGGAPPGYSQNVVISATGSIVDAIKTQVAKMVSRTDFEVKPSAWYSSPLFCDSIDREAKSFQLYYNETEIQPGVIVKAIPTQAGLLPLIPEPFIPVLPVFPGSTVNQFEGFVLSEEFAEYHWLTSPVPRVFQLGLLGNLAAQFVILKFGSVVVKGASYAHAHFLSVR